MSISKSKSIQSNKELKESDTLNLNSNTRLRSQTISNIKWVEKLRSSKKYNTNYDNNISIKKEFKFEEMINNAKIHREANRPLKKIKEFTSLTRFCQCCCFPVKDNIYIRNFHFCENTDEYAECGRGTSLYFSYYRFSILILLYALIFMTIPSMIITNYYTNHISDICKKLYYSKNDILNSTFPICLEYLDIGNSSLFKKDTVWFLRNNEINLRKYREIYNNISELYDDNIDKSIINYYLFHFIGLISLFIVNVLYIILLYNLNKQYDISITSPSDYTVMITNLYSAFNIFWKSINKINHNLANNFNDIIIINNKRKNASSNIIDCRSNSSNTKMKEVDELGLESIQINKEINILEAFNKFIKNKICETSKGEKFNIYQINICYKISEFMKIEEKIQNKKSQIYKIEHDPFQIEKNEKLKLTDKRKKYFYYPLDIFNLNIFPFNIWEKSYILSDIEEEKNELERKLEELLKKTENITDENFSGVIFITFNTMKDAELFLKPFPKNAIMSLLIKVKNLKYFLCRCFINEQKKKNFSIKKNIGADIPPEPEDIIFENLQYSSLERIFRISLIYIVSLVIIFICLLIMVTLNHIQMKNNEGNDNHKIIFKYFISILMTLIISILNSIFMLLLDFLTKMEKQISMTNYYLSYSVKLTLFTFTTSGIIPLLSNYLYLSRINYDLLITNMITSFLSNSFLTPIMWTLNFEFLLKKLKICYVEKYKKNYTQKQLNELYELLDMGIAYKYSYIEKTLLMTFFYMPIIPLNVLFSFFGFIFGYYLEKFNISKMYKRPEMLNSKICEFYSNYFIFSFFMLCIGDYIFLRDIYRDTSWAISNLVIFGILLIIPYNQILIFDFIGIDESEIKKDQNYEDYYFSFFNDYEKNNPITKKEGIKHFLKKLKEKALISNKDYDIILKNFENVNLLEIYYKSRINFSKNILQRGFLNLGKKEKNQKKRRNSKFVSNFKEYARTNKINVLARLFFSTNIFMDSNNANIDNQNTIIQLLNLLNNNNNDYKDKDNYLNSIFNGDYLKPKKHRRSIKNIGRNKTSYIQIRGNSNKKFILNLKDNNKSSEENK